MLKHCGSVGFFVSSGIPRKQGLAAKTGGRVFPCQRQGQDMEYFRNPPCFGPCRVRYSGKYRKAFMRVSPAGFIPCFRLAVWQKKQTCRQHPGCKGIFSPCARIGLMVLKACTGNLILIAFRCA